MLNVIMLRVVMPTEEPSNHLEKQAHMSSKLVCWYSTILDGQV
jgi:hypothetical protein